MDRILIDPDVCNVQPVVRGTRVPAQTIVEFLAARDSIEDVMEEYPSVCRDDVLACLQLSSQMMKHHFSLLELA